MKTTIALGCDEAAFRLKEVIRSYLEKKGLGVEDFEYTTPIPPFIRISPRRSRDQSPSKHPQAILMCGTGIGMAITANKVPGVRAAVCHDVYSTQRARKSNDCQIMALGARVVGEELAKALSIRGLSLRLREENPQKRSNASRRLKATTPGQLTWAASSCHPRERRHV